MKRYFVIYFTAYQVHPNKADTLEFGHIDISSENGYPNQFNLTLMIKDKAERSKAVFLENIQITKVDELSEADFMNWVGRVKEG